MRRFTSSTVILLFVMGVLFTTGENIFFGLESGETITIPIPKSPLVGNACFAAAITYMIPPFLVAKLQKRVRFLSRSKSKILSLAGAGYKERVSSEY